MSMLYEIELCEQKKDDFKTIYSVFVFADGVSECQNIATEIISSLDKYDKDIKAFIQEIS